MAKTNRISPEVQKVIASLEIEGCNAFITEGQLDRKIYVEFNDAMQSLGGVWNRKAKAHIFPADPTDMLEEIMQTGTYTGGKSEQQEYGFFETPKEFAAKIVELAKIEKGMSVLEPSAGTGRIADIAREAGGDVYCVEILEKNAAILADKAHRVYCGDFLTVPVPEIKYDRVAMNPPFKNQCDIDHVLHAAKFVKWNGILVSIMSASVQFRTNKKTLEFWEKMNAMGGVTVTKNENGLFKESGTNVNTVTVVLQGK